MSLFTDLQVFKPVSFLFFCSNTKEGILKNADNQTVWLQTFFCVQQKKEIYTGLEQLE